MRLSHAAFAVLAATLACTSPTAGTALARGPAQPVVVELFTSEGCSSCPPADAALDRLARDQPVAGAEVIALELHVDYWNYLGWADPFSQAAFSARQRDYGRAFGKRGVYTPQMVVDGQRELVGSRGRDAEDAIGEAARAQKAKVVVTRSGDKVSVAVEGLPVGGSGDAVDVMLAVTESGLSTRVPAGENAGTTVVHGPVVREMRRVGSVAGGTKGLVMVKDVEVNVDPSWRRENLRVVVFVQRQRGMEILGAGVVGMR